MVNLNKFRLDPSQQFQYLGQIKESEKENLQEKVYNSSKHLFISNNYSVVFIREWIRKDECIKPIYENEENINWQKIYYLVLIHPLISLILKICQRKVESDYGSPEMEEISLVGFDWKIQFSEYKKCKKHFCSKEIWEKETCFFHLKN
jgi:hypothetical protein